MSFFSPNIKEARGTQIQPNPPVGIPPVHVPDDYRIPISQLPLSVLSSESKSSPILFLDSFLPAYPSNADVSSGWQAAIDAASAIGSQIGARCPLVAVPGRNHILSEVIPDSYVDIWAYGASVTRNPTSNSPTFWNNPGLGVGTTLQSFAIRGLTAVGNGAETNSFVVINRGSDLSFPDWRASTLGQSVFYLTDSQLIWIQKYIFQNCATVGGGTNAINLVDSNYGATLPLKYIWVEDGVMTGVKNVGIDFTVTGAPNRTDPEVAASVSRNTIIMAAAGSGGWPIAFERGATTPGISGFDFTDNKLYQNITNSYAMAISAGNGDPYQVSGVNIRGGRMVNNAAGGTGLLVESSQTVVEGVNFNVATNDILLANNGGQLIEHISIGPNQSNPARSGDHVAILAHGVDTTTLNIIPPR